MNTTPRTTRWRRDLDALIPTRPDRIWPRVVAALVVGLGQLGVLAFLLYAVHHNLTVQDYPMAAVQALVFLGLVIEWKKPGPTSEQFTALQRQVVRLVELNRDANSRLGDVARALSRGVQSGARKTIR